jgi:hypothetical protein
LTVHIVPPVKTPDQKRSTSYAERRKAGGKI